MCLPYVKNTITVPVPLVAGKCLSISDAIGKRLRDGDKIRYKVLLYLCSLFIALTII
jgi:hypothetical protein